MSTVTTVTEAFAGLLLRQKWGSMRAVDHETNGDGGTVKGTVGCVLLQLRRGDCPAASRREGARSKQGLG